MLKIEACFDEKGLLSLGMKGHAGGKQSEGYEVCVAASVLSQGMAKAVRRFFPSLKFVYTKEDGTLFYERRCDSFVHERYKIVTDAFVYALKDLAKENPAYAEYEEIAS